MRPALAVIAKSPVPGRVKTRLCPPYTPAEAAELAGAALADTLAAVAAADAGRRVVVLDGPTLTGLPDGFEVIPQRSGGLAARLAAAFDALAGPALVIGMDTPQVTPALLSGALDTLAADGTDAVLGLAEDGGYWAIGLRTPDARAFLGVPMSAAHTGARQAARLRELGLTVAALPALADVDDWASAAAVAAAAPETTFARAVRDLPRAA